MFLRYQSRACEISATARWMESNGGASYCADVGVQTPSAMASVAALVERIRMGWWLVVGGSWLWFGNHEPPTTNGLVRPSGASKLEHLVIGRVECVASAAR